MKALRSNLLLSCLLLLATFFCAQQAQAASSYDDTRTFVAGTAIRSANLRLTWTAGATHAVSTVDSTQVWTYGVAKPATTTGVEIGTSIGSASTNQYMTVKLPRLGTIVPMVACKAINIGVDIYGAADGKVSDAVSGTRVGVSLTGSSADGDVIEVLRISP